ncbi:MAG: hypothetical protein QGH60_19225 [Phycisphaerae bacterium]|jgi:hypothetical protein|nr:hypothetical protein [Phycisphaerae bacterium]
MSNPTFDSQLLCDCSAVEVPGSPEARVYMENLPGVNGDFLQLCGRTGRRIRLRGELTVTGDTPTEAHQGLKALIRQRQQLVGTSGTYVGTDGQGCTDCVLMSYRPRASRAWANGQDYTASAPITAEIHQAAP